MSEPCGRCWLCKEDRGCIRLVGFQPSSMPNRYPEATRIVKTDRQWDQDMGAYKRLRQDGIQPPRIDDSAALEAYATDQFEVEMGKLVPTDMKAQVKEGLGLARELEISRPAGVSVPDEA